MKIKSYNLLSFSFLVALPFLGGFTECTPPSPPPPPPEPELCLADADCAAGEHCNTDICRSPCREDEICPAVCYGACEPVPPPPELCLSDADCGPGARCNTDACMAPPCGDDGMAHLTVCYGICEPEPPVCEPVLCDIACDVFARDERGCEICGCEPPPPVCDDVVCALWCEGGFLTDELGCPICECAPPPPPACEPVLCDLWCEGGFLVDERGCEICACAPPPTERVCGGFAGFACAEGEWCDYPDDAPACGAADHLGTCRPRPDACPEYYGPVCGCDGATYDNECFAHAAGVDTWASGLCAPPDPSR